MSGHQGHLLPPGSTWAISDTANRTVTFATGMLEAATSDNISPLALRCCESFGALLPMSAEVRVKVEQLARRNHTSHVLNFIKSQIGYKKGDSVELLSRSDSGIRFLCIAATMCTLDHYDAANRLDVMLRATCKEHEPCPTIRQLQTMMNTLETKMILSDYANSVASCEIFSRSALQEYKQSYAIGTAQIPTKTSLQNLVLALSEMGRIGDITSLEIKLKPDHLPWTWAFVQWCLGTPPTVRTSNKEYILSSDHSMVVLTVMHNDYRLKSRKRPYDEVAQDIEISVVHSMRNFREIIFQEEPDSKKWAWQGLVPVKTWISYHFTVLYDRFPEINNQQRLKSAIGQAFYYIVKYLPEHLIVCDDYRSFRIAVEKEDGALECMPYTESPRPFPNADHRLKVAKNLLEENFELVESDTDPDRTLHPKNLASSLNGACRLCASPHHNPLIAGTVPCRVNELLEAIGTIGAAILTFSLFGLREEVYPFVMAGLKFDTNRFHRRLFPTKRAGLFSSYWAKLVTTGWQGLMHGNYKILSCPPIAIFKHAAELMGHQKIWESTVISSKAGQVLFPVFFEATDFWRDGFMQLSAFPGKLNRQDMEFDFFLDSWSDTIHTQGFTDDESESIGSSNNDDQDFGIQSDSDDLQMTIQNSDPIREGNMQELSTGAMSMGDSNPVISAEESQEPGPAINEERNTLPATLEDTTVPPDITVPATFSLPKRYDVPTEPSLKWTVAVEDNFLKGQLFADSIKSPILAWSLIESLARCRLTQPCQHKSTRKVGQIGNEFRLVTGSVSLLGPADPRTFFSVGCKYAQRLVGLEKQNYFPATTIHFDGCIGCALQLCFDSGARVVIS